MKESLTNEVKFVSLPVGMLTFVVLLFLGLIFFGFSNINSVRDKLSEVARETKTLEQKLFILKTVDQNLANITSAFDIALPSKSSTLYGLNQIKNIATLNNLMVSNVLSGSLTSLNKEISKIPITFEVEGSETDIFNFLNSLSKVLPLMTVTSVDYSSSDNLSSATVTLNVYTAPLPKNIPSITQSVSDLTNDELKLIDELSTYQKPAFTGNLPIQEPSVSGKLDPFN